MASLLLRGPDRNHRDKTGLFTSLPILWNESADLADLLKPEQQEHWAKPLIADGGTIAPLDTLSAASLKALKYLVMAQPRPLSPDENVALDAWVRGGGLLLLLADPMLTEETIFPIGDKRRPQDMVWLDPVLNHWGLDLQGDGRQDVLGDELLDVMGVQVPVEIFGILTATNTRDCRTWNQGIAATCRIGKGRILVLADAAVLERDDAAGTRAKAFKSLLEAAFVPSAR